MLPLNTLGFLIALAVVLAAAQLAGASAGRLGQPPVVGEIVAGILLGPTLLSGAVPRALFPADVRPGLTALADVGVAVFMFVVGLELDHRTLRGRRGAAAGVAAMSMALPFGLGCLLALALMAGHEHGSSPAAFVLFFGAAMSITAFPVLARILTDRGMQRTAVGGLAMTVAAIGDVVAWCLLAGVLAVTGHHALWQITLVLPFVAIMLFAVRPLLGRLAAAHLRAGRPLSAGALVGVVVLAVVSGGITEWLGLHFIFGAFLAGAVIPRRGTEALREEIIRRITPLGSVLLPVYFTVAGFGVDLSTMDVAALGEFALIVLVAICGKFLGAYTGARACGQSPRHASVLGVLMNTRGLTELIILGVGLQAGLLDTSLYSLMVVMAVVTTAMTGPLLRLCYPSRIQDADLAATRKLTTTAH
ncbi:cation:proton antiporter [Kutzneria kofuensis]|uniref:Kef-type K+ transport system membrane component KefB n=1 Tax=Kutzneria kofuensis TaxID=103725 RepID=A0A7W9NEQ3_9PSEU|nr:cation:proton antiporter [Kutzneria kofuensis]MBB5889910.1 Kef-type K+ transport system membrane component KefB [Kutzneria kofuensis]